MSIEIPEVFPWQQIDIERKPFEEIPQEFRLYYQAGLKVSRFIQSDYPQGVIKDTDTQHLLRGHHFLSKVGFDSDLLRMWDIHDIPEIVIATQKNTDHDTTSVVKALDPQLNAAIRASELDVAGVIFSKPDYRLYKLFEKGKEALDGNIPIASFNGLLAGLFDFVDGNMCFHAQVSNSLILDAALVGKWPESALKYTFVQSAERVGTILDLTIPAEEKGILLALLDSQIRFVKSCWDQVPQERTPLAVKSSLEKYKKLP